MAAIGQNPAKRFSHLFRIVWIDCQAQAFGADLRAEFANRVAITGTPYC